MTFAPDGPLTSRVVSSPTSEHGPRPGGTADIRGVVVHMAEGGGTVSWLTRPDGNSSHYVVEYDGDIVQMVPENHWAGSINPRLLRNDNDPPYTYLGQTIVYGRRAALDALGNAANDPNRYVIAIETEGFAADGPNAKQRASLARLVDDIRRRRGGLPVLGHRDFQNYKKCPGHKIPWADYGSHGVPPAPPSDTDMRLTAVKGEDWKAADTVSLFPEPNPTTKLGEVPGGTVLRTIAEATGNDGGSWRLTEWKGAPAWFRYRNPDGDIGDMKPIPSPGVDSQLMDYIARKPVPDVDAIRAQYELRIKTIKAKAKGHAAQDVADANSFAADIAND